MVNWAAVLLKFLPVRGNCGSYIGALVALKEDERSAPVWVGDGGGSCLNTGPALSLYYYAIPETFP